MLRCAVAEIGRGGVVAAPTDTLYGLLADPRNRSALRLLFRLKGRPENKPILLLLDSLRRLDGIVADKPPAFAVLARRFWPGPLTLVLPATPNVASLVTAGRGTVAVRLPRAPLIRALVRQARCPLTGTSANLSGRAGARSAAEVAAQLGDRLSLILDAGRVRRPVPSTVVDLTGAEAQVLREGCIAARTIECALAAAGLGRAPEPGPRRGGALP